MKIIEVKRSKTFTTDHYYAAIHQDTMFGLPGAMGPGMGRLKRHELRNPRVCDGSIATGPYEVIVTMFGYSLQSYL